MFAGFLMGQSSRELSSAFPANSAPSLWWKVGPAISRRCWAMRAGGFDRTTEILMCRIRHALDVHVTIVEPLSVTKGKYFSYDTLRRSPSCDDHPYASVLAPIGRSPRPLAKVIYSSILCVTIFVCSVFIRHSSENSYCSFPGWSNWGRFASFDVISIAKERKRWDQYDLISKFVSKFDPSNLVGGEWLPFFDFSH